MELLKARRRLMMQNHGRLPSEYQKVEWIKTPQGGFINTKIIPQFYDICEAKFIVHGYANNVYIPTLAAYQHAYLMYHCNLNKSTNQAYAINTWNNYENIAGAKIAITLIDAIQHHLAYAIGTKRYVKDAATDTLLFEKENITTVPTLVPYAIFGRANSGSTASSMTINYATSQTLYFLKLWRGDSNGNIIELVRDYVPCYRKSDGMIGLYDLVSGLFFTNAGAGLFTKGADVN